MDSKFEELKDWMKFDGKFERLMSVSFVYMQDVRQIGACGRGLKEYEAA